MVQCFNRAFHQWQDAVLSMQPCGGSGEQCAASACRPALIIAPRIAITLARDPIDEWHRLFFKPLLGTEPGCKECNVSLSRERWSTHSSNLGASQHYVSLGQKRGWMPCSISFTVLSPCNKLFTPLRWSCIHFALQQLNGGYERGTVHSKPFYWSLR